MSRLKALVSVVVLSFCSIAALAQEKGPSFIGVVGGASIPTGNWGKSKLIISPTGFANDPAGFAAVGGIGGVEGAWFFSKHFGLGGLATYGTYQTKDASVLSAGYQRSFDVDSVHTTAGSYKIWNIMPGIYYNYAFSKKFALTARGLAGITNVTTPRIDVSINDGGIYDGTIVQQKATKTSWIVDLGAGLSYSVTKSIAINLRADYSFSKPDIKIDNTLRNNHAGRMVNEYDQPLAGVNATLGVAYVFHAKK